MRYYKALGVSVQSFMTDNGSAYKSRRFAKLLRRLGIRHIRTRPYTPRTNGKAERFIQTLLREWAYAFVDPNSDAQASELAPWMYQYNFHRPHSATSHRPPASRLGLYGNNVVRNYNAANFPQCACESKTGAVPRGCSILQTSQYHCLVKQ